MLSSLVGISFMSLALPLALANFHGSAYHNRHVELAKRQAGDVEIHKRFGGARWSFYDVGLGACGKYNGENDFIVALNTPQYIGGSPGPNCFKTITMTYNGKTTQATIMDQCPGCPFGGLDLSRGLFRFFAPESAGIIYGEWQFNDGGPPAPPPPPPPPPPPTIIKEWIPPPPTSTWKPEPTTTWKPETTTTSASSSVIQSSSSASSSSTKSSSSTSIASSSTVSSSALPTAGAIQNINGFDQIVINLSIMLLEGAQPS